MFNNVLKLSKKAFTWTVVVATIAWSVGLASFLQPLSAQAATLAAGDLIKASNSYAVYYYGADGRRYVFPTESTYKTWYNDFSGVKTITPAELSAIQLGGNVTMRPGVKLVKVTTDPKVYAIDANGTLRWISSEAAALATYGANWNKMVVDLPDAFFTNYKFGAQINSASDFNPANATAAASSINANQQIGTSTTTPVPNTVTAMLASDTPASSTLVAGQATASVARFAFSGSGTVTAVTLQRIGVSADSTPSNIYLFDGATRLTDAASVTNNGTVTFSNPAGLFAVSGSKTITVKSDIATGTSGQTLGFSLSSFTTTLGTVNANIAANIHSIASATLATVSAGTVTPSGATLNPAAGVTVWQSTLTISNRDVQLKRLALRQVGSAPASAINNFKLFVNGTQVATAMSLDSMGYVTFDLTSSPLTMVAGSRIVRVDADIVSGASRTVQFSLRQAADIDLTDSSFGVNVTPTSTPWAPSAASTISGTSGGTLTIEKDTTSPSGDVTLSGSDVLLGKFKVTAFGEAIKIETLTAGGTFDGTQGNNNNAAVTLRNGRLLINGVQYGSSATLLPAGTSFTTNYVVMPGTPVMVEVRADVYDNDGTSQLDAGDTLVATLKTGSSNAVRQDSLGSFNAPSSDVSANSLTVRSASLGLVKTPNYPNQTIALPQTAFKFGQWNVTGSSIEDILLTTLSFDVDSVTNATFSAADLTNMYAVLKVNGVAVASPAPLATVSAADNNFSINYTLAKNANATVELYATSGSTVTSGDSLKTDLTLTGTSLVSGQSVTAADVDGQTIAYGAGSLTITQAPTVATASIQKDNQSLVTAEFNFAAVNAAYKVTDIALTVANATAVSNIVLKDGSTVIGTLAGATAPTFTGLSWEVPAGTTKKLSVELQLSSVGIGAGTSGASLLTTLTSATAINLATGVSAAATESDPAGNAHYVYAAVPTLSSVALTGSEALLQNTANRPLMRFKVNADGGDIGWKRILFTVTKSADPVLTSATLWDITPGQAAAQVAGTATLTTVGATNTSGTIAFVATNEQQLSSSKTYELRATVASAAAAADFVQVSINESTSTNFTANNDYATQAGLNSGAEGFIWSDLSASNHSTSTTDWATDYKVSGLPVSSSLNFPN